MSVVILLFFWLAGAMMFRDPKWLATAIYYSETFQLFMLSLVIFLLVIETFYYVYKSK